MKRALITGVGGQDGSLLAQLLLENGYAVYGVANREAEAYVNLDAVRGRIEVVQVDLLDQHGLREALAHARPEEIYNLASPSFVPQSWNAPVETAEFAAVGVTSLLEAMRAVAPDARMYQASSSEIFGTPAESPQTQIGRAHV